MVSLFVSIMFFYFLPVILILNYFSMLNDVG